MTEPTAGDIREALAELRGTVLARLDAIDRSLQAVGGQVAAVSSAQQAADSRIARLEQAAEDAQLSARQIHSLQVRHDISAEQHRTSTREWIAYGTAAAALLWGALSHLIR